MTAKRRADHLTELAARFAPPDEAEPEQRPAPATRPTARTTNVRHTLDLPPARHYALKKWCDEQALPLGLPGVPTAHALLELVALLLTDVRTQKMLTERLRKRYEA